MKEKVIWLATLCFPIMEDEVLLSRKIVEKMHKPGAGKLNGYGGGPWSGESLEEAASRELFEESRLKANLKDLEKVAIVYFHNTKSDGEIFVCKCVVYLLKKWHGEPRDGDKMKNPRWYLKLQMPWTDMIVGDEYWLPSVFSGKKIIAEVHYGPFQKELLRPVEIIEVPVFSKDD